MTDDADPPDPPPWARRVADALLTDEPVQRIRLAQAGLATLLMGAGVVAMNYFAWQGIAPARPVLWWSALSLATMGAFFAAIRSGRARGLADPSLTVPQMVCALVSGAAAYALVGEGRGGVFPIVMVVLAFGMFQLPPRQMRRISLFAVTLFGTVMAAMSWVRPEVYRPEVEIGHFLMVVTMMPAMAYLAGRLSRLRNRLRERKDQLAEALASIRELVTHDELTGLVNRRHMNELLEQERQRCARSGRVFCIAVIDADRFKSVNDRFGHAAGDEVLRALARRMQSGVRAADVLARWGGEEFVLLLPDVHLALARNGVERLRERIASAPVELSGAPLAVTVSAGVAEHRAGESVEQTVERADAALYEAKAQGRDRVVAA